MLKPIFTVQIESSINKHREGKDMPLLLHLILCSVGKRSAFRRNRCSIWCKGCSLHEASQLFNASRRSTSNKDDLHSVFEYAECIMLRRKKEVPKRHSIVSFFSCFDHLNIFLPAVTKKEVDLFYCSKQDF